MPGLDSAESETWHRRGQTPKVLVVCAAIAALVATPAAAQDATPPPLRRWFEIDFAQIGARYRVIENSAGRVTNNQIQHREQLRARVKFDAAARYALHAGVFAGSTFTGGWNDTGIGMGDLVTNLRLKQLFVAAAPLPGVQLQAGSLYFSRGESTEITSYDNDGYIVGERIQVERPAQLWLDEVAFTQAQLGYLREPGVFHRWDGLAHPNYRQLLVRKRFGDAAASTDFTTFERSRTIRAAVALTLAPATVRVEAYRRVRVAPAGGFAATIERPVTRRLRLGGGYATVDPAYGGLNASRFDRGRRVFGSTLVALTPWLTLNVVATRGVANRVPLANRTRADVMLIGDLLPAIRRSRVF